jgi:hypothetical protein
MFKSILCNRKTFSSRQRIEYAHFTPFHRNNILLNNTVRTLKDLWAIFIVTSMNIMLRISWKWTHAAYTWAMSTIFIYMYVLAKQKEFTHVDSIMFVTFLWHNNVLYFTCPQVSVLIIHVSQPHAQMQAVEEFLS